MIGGSDDRDIPDTDNDEIQGEFILSLTKDL